MEHDLRAIVIRRRANTAPDNRAFAFEAFSAALAFMQSTKAATVVIEFSVETDTLDFYDAVKALKVPVVFAANRLDPLQFYELGIRAADVVYPERLKRYENLADFRPRPGIRGSYSSLITSSALTTPDDLTSELKPISVLR